MDKLTDQYNSSIALNNSYINNRQRALYKHEVITECFISIDEGFDNPEYLNEASSNISAMIYEILESVKNALLQMYESLIRLFEGYILNNIYLIKKYKEKILDIPNERIETITYTTYQYPKLTNLPNKVYIPEMSQSEKNALVTTALSGNVSELKTWVDDELTVIANQMLDSSSINVKDIFESATNECYKQMRGKEIINRLNKNLLEKLLDEIIQYKELKDQIVNTRREILNYYEDMKVSIKNTFDIKVISGNKIRAYNNPEQSDLTNAQINKLSSYTIEYNRLYNGIITLYNTAFNTKLEILRERVELNRNVVSELLKSASVLNNLSVNKNSPKTIGLNPPIKY